MKKPRSILAVASAAIAAIACMAPALASASTTIFLTTTGTNTWTVPSDWNSANNTIEVVGGGGGGGTPTGANGGGGGGGGAYSQMTDVSLTPGGSASYTVGAAGGAGSDGGDTYFNGASCAGASACAKGGTGGGSTGTGGGGGAAGSGVGSLTRSGGAGGNGTFGGGGGGGAAGPNGDGKNGGADGDDLGGAGGGGGANNGSAGSAGASGAGAAGGDGRGGTGGGTAGSPGGGDGSSGGGGGGSDTIFDGTAANGGKGGQDAVWTETSDSAIAGPAGGSGGGGGATDDGDCICSSAGNGGGIASGAYGGGGGGGGGVVNGSLHGTGASGAQGIIVITYTPAASRLALVRPPNNLGLVGYWSFNEGAGTKAEDFSGNGNTGTLVSGPAWTSGKLGQALTFDGGTNYVSLPSNPSALRTAACTVAMWVRTTNDSDEAAFSASQGADSDLHGFSIEFGPASGDLANELITVFQSASPVFGAEGYVTANRNELFDGKWHHVAVTIDSATHIYLDGASKSITEGAGDGPDPATCLGADGTLDTFRIGGQLFNGADVNFFNGTIDDVRIYNRALSATEVANLYQKSALARIAASSADLAHGSSLESGLVGLWTFDGADFTDKVYDRSGQGSNAYVVGGATSSAKAIGKLGQALSLNGSDKVLANAVNLSGKQQASLSFWAKFPVLTNGANYQTIMDGDIGIELDNNAHGDCAAGPPELFIFATTNNFSDLCYPAPSANAWHHYVVLYDIAPAGDNMDLYIDGVLQNFDSGNFADNTTAFGNDAFIIGSTPTSNFTTGTIDDVRVYNRWLTEAEIQQLYNLGRATVKQ